MICGSIQWVTNFHFLNFLNNSPYKLVMDILLHKQTPCSNAILSFVEEHTTAALQPKEHIRKSIYYGFWKLVIYIIN